MTTRRQIRQDITLLLATSSHDREDMLDELTPRLTLGPVTGLAPLHGMAQRPFGGVVGRLQARHAHERPQRRLALAQLLTSRGSLGPSTASTGSQLFPQCLAQPPHITLERRPGPGAIPPPVPPAKEHLGVLQQALPHSRSHSAPVNHGLEVSTQV